MTFSTGFKTFSTASLKCSTTSPAPGTSLTASRARPTASTASLTLKSSIFAGRELPSAENASKTFLYFVKPSLRGAASLFATIFYCTSTFAKVLPTSAPPSTITSPPFVRPSTVVFPASLNLPKFCRPKRMDLSIPLQKEICEWVKWLKRLLNLI